MGTKTHLREYGPNPRVSSDLDLKILVNAETIDRAEARPLGESIGKRLASHSTYIPLSGHTKPFLRLLRVPRQCTDARAAFTFYNNNRPLFQQKGPLSLEYTQLLYDPAHPKNAWEWDVRSLMKEHLLQQQEPSERAALPSLQLPDSFALLREAEKFQSRYLGVTGHQWLGLLLDYPDHVPKGLTTDVKPIPTERSVAIWAFRQAQKMNS